MTDSSTGKFIPPVVIPIRASSDGAARKRYGATYSTAAKTTNHYKKLIPETDNTGKPWYQIDWSLGGIWDDKGTVHQFNTQFGNLQPIERLTSDRANCPV